MGKKRQTDSLNRLTSAMKSVGIFFLCFMPGKSGMNSFPELINSIKSDKINSVIA